MSDDILHRLAEVIESRKAGDADKSYVARLFAKGPDAVCKKVGEEATEAVMAAKKLLTGCLVVVLVLVIGAGAAWWFLLRPMWNAGGEMLSDAKDWATSLDLGDDITNQAPYDPPADGRLTPAQVSALVKVQEVVVREMGSDLRALAERAQQAQAARAADQPPDLQDLATAYRETSALLGRLKAEL